jgi:hypothetical protein
MNSGEERGRVAQRVKDLPRTAKRGKAQQRAAEGGCERETVAMSVKELQRSAESGEER